MALIEEFESQGNFLFRHRTYLPLVLLGVALGIHIYFTKEVKPEPDYTSLAYLAVGLFGLFIRIITVGHTPKGTSGRNTHGQVAEDLNTSGIYSLVRHPLYFGNFFMWLSVCMVIENWWFNIIFTMSYWLYYERIMFAEEAFLREKYGDSYVKWASVTPAFIPRLSGWVKPNLPFSFRNVLKREDNGILNLVVLFIVFKSLPKFIYEGTWLTDKLWLSILGVTVVFYLIVRILKKGTKLLNVEGR